MQDPEDLVLMEDEPNSSSSNNRPTVTYHKKVVAKGSVIAGSAGGVSLNRPSVTFHGEVEAGGDIIAGDDVKMLNNEDVSMDTEPDKKEEEAVVPPIVPPSQRIPIVNGRLGSKSFNGHKWRHLLSAAQKACREGDLDRLTAVLIETHLMWRAKTKGGVEFGTLRTKSEKELKEELKLDKADLKTLAGLKMLESNIKHRVEVFCCEDICAFAEWPVVRVVVTRLETWGPQSIIEIARALCSATTLRAPSWLRAAFKSFPFGQSLQPPKADKLKEVKTLAKDKDTKDAIELVARIAGDLEEGNDRAFHWALVLLAATQIKKATKKDKSSDGKDEKKKPKTIKTTESLKGEPRGPKDWGTEIDTKKSEAVYLLWVWLYNRINKVFGKDDADKAKQMRSCFHTLRRWFERHTTGSQERMIFVFQAMLMIKHAKEVDWSPKRLADMEAKIKIKGLGEAMAIHDRNLAEVPPTIVLKRDLDKHTGAKDKDALDFARAIRLGKPNDKYHTVYGKYEAAYLADKERQRAEREKSKGKGAKRKRDEDEDESDHCNEEDDGDENMDAADEKKNVVKTTKTKKSSPRPAKKAKTERKGPAPKPAKKKASMEEAKAFAAKLAPFTTSKEVKVLTDGEIAAILALVHAQCTTAVWKQLVALAEKYVWKGPYFIKVGETGDRLKRTICERLPALREIHGCHQPDIDVFLHDHGPDHGVAIWLRIGALYEVPPSQWQTKPDDGGSGSFQPAKIQRIVHKSTGVIQASDLEPADLLKDPHLAARVLLSLIIGFIMDPVWGDSAPWNRLVRLRDGLVVCVDYEEVRSSFDPEADVEMADAKTQSKKTATEWMLELSATICARPKAISEASAAAYAKSIGRTDRYFEQEWTKMLESARKQKHVPISEKRVQQVQALLDAIATANKPKGLLADCCEPLSKSICDQLRPGLYEQFVAMFGDRVCVMDTKQFEAERGFAPNISSIFIVTSGGSVDFGDCETQNGSLVWADGIDGVLQLEAEYLALWRPENPVHLPGIRVEINL